MINVVIPMAGAGSRFSKVGFIKPKPFIDIVGKPMIIHVLENLMLPDAHYILIARREHIEVEKELIREIKDKYNATFLEIDGLTEGTACTVLWARKLIDKDTPLLIANSDQIVDFDAKVFVEDCFKRELGGSILTFEEISGDPKWSYVSFDSAGYIDRAKEKQRISNFATVGIYLFQKGSDFIDGAIEMILNQDKVNGEYYTCPVYNYLIKKNIKIGAFNIEKKSMHGVGTPEDLEIYIDFLKNN